MGLVIGLCSRNLCVEIKELSDCIKIVISGFIPVLAMKVLHFCHPETRRINLAYEGSVFRNNAFIVL